LNNLKISQFEDLKIEGVHALVAFTQHQYEDLKI